MALDRTIYAQSVSRVRTLETRMLDKAKFESMIEARDAADIFRILQDSPYSEYVTRPSYEEGLRCALEDFYHEMYKTVPVKELLDILAIRYDAHNIKALLKCSLSGRSTEGMLIDAGTIPLKNLEEMVRNESFRDMPKALRKSIETGIDSYKNTGDSQNIDMLIDKGMYEYMLEIAEDSKQDYIGDFVKLLIDMTNIKAFIRVKAQERGREFYTRLFIKGGKLDFDLFGNSFGEALENLPGRMYHTEHYGWVKEGIEEYLKTGNIGCIEKSGDNYLMKSIKKSRFISFGPEPLVAYIIAKENEIRMLRIIITGKLNGVSPEPLRERLRDVYV
jgi:V/A-type H+-transporting ATPase subunit C